MTRDQEHLAARELAAAQAAFDAYCEQPTERRADMVRAHLHALASLLAEAR